MYFLGKSNNFFWCESGCWDISFYILRNWKNSRQLLPNKNYIWILIVCLVVCSKQATGEVQYLGLKCLWSHILVFIHFSRHFWLSFDCSKNISFNFRISVSCSKYITKNHLTILLFQNKCLLLSSITVFIKCALYTQGQSKCYFVNRLAPWVLCSVVWSRLLKQASCHHFSVQKFRAVCCFLLSSCWI